MPTSFVGQVWTLDSADIGALPRTILGPLPRRLLQENAPQTVSQWIAIGQLTWHSPTAAAGDEVILTDINGRNPIILGPATAADFEDQLKETDTLKYEGLIVTSLPSGIVRIEIR